MKPEHIESPHGPLAEAGAKPVANATDSQLTNSPEAFQAAHAPSSFTGRWLVHVIGGVALVGAVGMVLMWSKLSGIQEQLARQSADTGSQAIEARVTAKQAEELARETAARLAVTEAKLAEVTLQRSQLEELMQSLSRSRDENLVVDVESALRLAQQQAQLTGSLQPLLAALNSAQQRLTKVAQPRLAPLLRAVTRDIERIKGTTVVDTPALLFKLDELEHLVDTLPLVNAVGSLPKEKPVQAQAVSDSSSWVKAISLRWWERVWTDFWGNAQSLIRISHIERSDASLLAPDQSFFVRENLKLRVLNARLGLLARRFEAVQSDMSQVTQDLSRYFNTQTQQGQATLALAREVLAQSKQMEIARVDDTFAALSTAAAGR